MRRATNQDKLWASFIRERCMTAEKKTIKTIVGNILSQALNVPVLSGIFITFLYFRLPDSTDNLLMGYLLAMIFVSLIPLSSLFFYIPVNNEETQRTVHRQRVASFVIMMVSYPIGWLVLGRTHAPRIFTAIAATYTFVTIGLVFFNLLLHYKASGHAAGVSGPVASMIYIYGLFAAPLLLLLPLVTWARLAAKGHNFWQTVVGATLSGLISVGVLRAFGFSPFLGVVW
jgi:hypothetical protein